MACSMLNRSYDRHGVKEVSLTLSGTTESGKYFTEIIYRSSGKVEKTTRDFKPDGSVKENSVRHGNVSKEEFQKIEDAVIKNNFFAKPDLPSPGSRQMLKVVTADGVKLVDQYSTGDTEILAVSGAISGAKIAWDGPPKNLN